MHIITFFGEVSRNRSNASNCRFKADDCAVTSSTKYVTFRYLKRVRHTLNIRSQHRAKRFRHHTLAVVYSFAVRCRHD